MARTTSDVAGQVNLVKPSEIKANPENPRLIFRQEELQALQDSISEQGVLVPLTVFASKGGGYVILDGERRWRCALKLGLTRLPVIVQPEPSRFQNILMMFAIHNARKDWDPLPTAYKLRDLEAEYNEREGKYPNEATLAQLASMSRGEVRRLKKLLALPEQYREDLMAELEKPRSQQVLTVDLVLETTKGVEALRKRGIISPAEEEPLRRAIIDKYESKVMTNTVEPRQLARIARAVEREEVPVARARSEARRLIEDPEYGVNSAFTAVAAVADQTHALGQQIHRVTTALVALDRESLETSRELAEALEGLRFQIDRLLD